jgi:hypothetical protein
MNSALNLPAIEAIVIGGVSRLLVEPERIAC